MVIFPTETVYGIGCDSLSAQAKERIRRMKRRVSPEEAAKPLQLLAADLRQARPLCERIPPEAQNLLRKYWPGPLTAVFAASNLGRILTGGHPTVGLRVPDHPVPRELARALGRPLAATSANLSGGRPARTCAEAKRALPGADAVLDGGPARIGTASTVVDFSSYPYTIRREGAIPKREIEKILLRPVRRR